ncbi:MAG TPA: fructose-6-phosphate aldolase [Nitrososphaeraceae archaeon]|jgi:transaldolase|nr:fructose-6-phosphate aldolase [Nitrososphaeraceae archaeon]HJT85616.1 fructose-6-phosphate aldolase [Nitrososphaeraceae archaeon]
MKIFLDTANIKAIRHYSEMGMVDGITTNPTLLSKENEDPEKIMKEIVNIVQGPVSLEVISTETDQIIEEAYILKRYGSNVVIKVPMIPDGLKAVKKLKDEDIDTNVTLVFSASQALLAAKAGASYVSPFIGRLDDISNDGMNLIRDIHQIFKNYDYNTKILVASIRHPIHVIESAKAGADVVTLPPDILGKMFLHPLTDKGLKTFISDWENLKRTNPSIKIL